MVSTSCLQAEPNREAAAPGGLPQAECGGFPSLRTWPRPQQVPEQPRARPPGPSCFFFCTNQVSSRLRATAPPPTPHGPRKDVRRSSALGGSRAGGGQAFLRHQEACRILGRL